MHQLITWLANFFGQWRCWIVVPPWDVGVRVRLGKVGSSLSPGLHARIPFIDEIVLVNTRLRVVSTPTVTLPGNGGTTRVSTAAIAYRVSDPLRAMMEFTNCDNAIRMIVQAALCKSTNDADVLAESRDAVDGKGIVFEWVRLTENVEIRTYRLLNDGWKIVGDGMEIQQVGPARW